MLEGGQPEKPAILVLSCGSRSVENEVLAGMEEEGVPSVVERGTRCDDALALASAAAARSSLSVGVGIDAGDRVCVQHDKLPEPLAELISTTEVKRSAARILGHNAARIVMSIPLRVGDGE